MMSKLICLKNGGRIIKDARSAATFLWKIHYRFLRFENFSDRINSPSFTYLNATWYLSLFKNRIDNYSGEYIALYIIKEHSNEACYVDYILGIWKNDGSRYRTWKSEKYFTNDGEGDGNAQFIRPGDLPSCVPNGTFTFFCILHAARTNYSDLTTQTELHKGKDMGAQTEREEKYEKSVPTDSSGLDKTLEDFKNLLLSGEDCDVIVKVKDQEFKAHRLILKTRSPVFRSMFEHRMKEETSGIIDVTDTGPVVFKDFLYYLYCGRVEELSADNVFDLYRIGDKYDVQDLKEICLEFMMYKISVVSFPEVIALALQYSESALIERATNFFIENAAEISEEAKWISFVDEYPVEANELFRKILKPPKK